MLDSGWFYCTASGRTARVVQIDAHTWQILYKD